MKVLEIVHNLHVLLVALESGAVRPGQVTSRTSGIIVRNGRGIQDVRSRYQKAGQPDAQSDADGRHLAHSSPQRVHDSQVTR